MATSLGGSPESQIGLDFLRSWACLRWLLLHSVSVQVKFCMCPFRAESVCYGLCLSHVQTPLAFSAGCSGASFWDRVPELLQTLCSFGGASTTVIILLYVGHLPGGVSPDYTTSLTLLSISVVPSLLHYVCISLSLIIFCIFFSYNKKKCTICFYHSLHLQILGNYSMCVCVCVCVCMCVKAYAFKYSQVFYILQVIFFHPCLKNIWKFHTYTTTYLSTLINLLYNFYGTSIFNVQIFY